MLALGAVDQKKDTPSTERQNLSRKADLAEAYTDNLVTQVKAS